MLVVARCGGTPTVPSPGQNPTPTPTPAPTPTPTPSPPNAAPRIVSLTSNTRIEADDVVTVTAVVEDADTPLDKLIYEWSVAPNKGTLTPGTDGRQLKWKSPHAQASPDIYTITLNVTEKFTALDLTEKENKADPKSVTVHYNDSYAEINRIASNFLADFGNYNVSAEQCVRNFTDSCPDKFEELQEIRNNRKDFQILSSTFSFTSYDFNADWTKGTWAGPCVFQDIVKKTGVKENVAGICTLAAVYENWTWFLCESHFKGTGTTPASSLRGRVPGKQ
jgi:hypothetical protein